MPWVNRISAAVRGKHCPRCKSAIVCGKRPVAKQALGIGRTKSLQGLRVALHAANLPDGQTMNFANGETN